MHQLKMGKRDIVILGSGNLATCLSKALYQTGHHIIQIFSRNIENAKFLADKYGAEFTNEYKLINNKADLYIIAVSDKAIKQVIDNINFTNKNVVHTAGSVPISVFSSNTKNCGVFYPLQTFSKNRDVDFHNIPICIEANNDTFKEFLNKLAAQISNQVYHVDSKTREFVHLSGVFANNFVNHIYSIAQEILKEKGIAFEMLNEIIKESANKAIELGPNHSQTGPAIRNDIETQKKHLDLLSSNPNLKQVYELLSSGIYLKYNKI